MAKKDKASKKKSVVKRKTTALALAVDMSGDAGRGLEGTDKDSFAIPFLIVLQKGSPQVDEADPKFIKGAKPGMLMNTLNNETFDGKVGLILLPCYFQRRFLRWGPRGSESGGFKGELTAENAAELEQDNKVIRIDNQLYFPDDNGKVKEKKCDTLSDTRNHFCLLFDEDTGEIQQVLLSLTSTQIKKSKQLVSLLANVRVEQDGEKVSPPTWVNRVRLTTISEKNDQGTWHGVEVELDGFVEDQAVYDAGRDFNKVAKKGDVNVNYNTADEADKEF